mmetsp:Transcript_7968/g.9882  ORF Transcript_7968/g.9882 Transcript_7968/m.9882 type:complete len:222 (-) Transcript_7968:3-668(-)
MNTLNILINEKRRRKKDITLCNFERNANRTKVGSFASGGLAAVYKITTRSDTNNAMITFWSKPEDTNTTLQMNAMMSRKLINLSMPRAEHCDFILAFFILSIASRFNCKLGFSFLVRFLGSAGGLAFSVFSGSVFSSVFISGDSGASFFEDVTGSFRIGVSSAVPVTAVGKGSSTTGGVGSPVPVKIVSNLFPAFCSSLMRLRRARFSIADSSPDMLAEGE